MLYIIENAKKKSIFILLLHVYYFSLSFIIYFLATMAEQTKGLPFFSKLMFYGLIGFFTEIVFTALWYLIDPSYNHGWKLHGCTSLWSFPMYGISIYVVEKISAAIKPKVILPFRVVVYVAWTYLWEYTCGYLLRLFNACPWDYHGYTTYHVHGLITLDYAPLWALAVVLCEKITIKAALSLQYTSDVQHTGKKLN